MKKAIIILAILLSGILGMLLFSSIVIRQTLVFNHDELVDFTKKELEYELKYGDSNIDLCVCIDSILKKKLRQNNSRDQKECCQLLAIDMKW